MTDAQLERLIVQALVDVLADKVIARLRGGIGAGTGVGEAAGERPAAPEAAQEWPFAPEAAQEWNTKRIFSRADAVMVSGTELRLARKVVVTPSARDELARRRIRLIQV